MSRLQHVIHGLADTFHWSHTHKFFTVFSKCFSCHHLSMTDSTTKSGFLLLNGKSSNTWFFALANSSLLEHQRAVCTDLGSAVHYSSLPHTSTSLPSRHQCVSQKASCSVCIMPENRERHSNPTRLEITTLQETELIHLMCISENLFKSGSSFLDHFPHRE